MISGYLPFPGKSEAEVRRNIINKEVTFPEKEWGTVSEDIKKLISRMLHKDPANRPTAVEIMGSSWLLSNKQTRNMDKEICVNAMENL